MGAEADWDNLRTAETYLGYGRSERLVSPGGIAFDQRRAYELAEHLPFGHWPPPASGRPGLRMLCSTRPAGPSPTGSTRATRISGCLPERRSRSFRVHLDGEAPGPSRGVDLAEDGNGSLQDGPMYQLVCQHDAVCERTVEITFLEPAAEAYAFTFG